jgi:twitching motility protein PilT
MQSFDQSLMQWYKQGVISYEAALFYSSNPNEFALRVSGIESASDRTFAQDITARGEGGEQVEGSTH